MESTLRFIKLPTELMLISKSCYNLQKEVFVILIKLEPK